MNLAQFARTVLPDPVRAPLRTVIQPLRAYQRARGVLRAYARHYADAKRYYRREQPGAPATVSSPAAIGARILRLDAADSFLPLALNYLDVVDRLHRDVNDRLSWSSNCRLHPPPASDKLPDRTCDVAEVRAGNVLTLSLSDPLGLDGLQELCAQLVPPVERAVYGAYALVDKVYVYRTMASRHRPEASSWLWHYDEHPPEVLKLLVYLTDVSEDSAPFTYLAARDSGDAVLGARNPLFGQSRIPAPVMAAFEAEGCRARAVTGSRGTTVLFNDNIVHRATFADRQHRDVLVLQLRPTYPSRTPFVDPRWTGSFQNLDFNRDPRRVEPLPWPHAVVSA